MEWQGEEGPKLLEGMVLMLSLLPKTHLHQRTDEGGHMRHELDMLRRH
jgi:hypothetical protein